MTIIMHHPIQRTPTNNVLRYKLLRLYVYYVTPSLTERWGVVIRIIIMVVVMAVVVDDSWNGIMIHGLKLAMNVLGIR